MLVRFIRAHPPAAWAAALSAAGHGIAERTDAAQADLVVADLDAADGVPALRREHPGTPLLGIIRHPTAERIMAALAAGADDVLPADADPAAVVAAATALAARRRPPLRVQPGEVPETGMAGTSPAMQDVFRLLAQAAAADRPVAISGPPGSGKSLAAWMLHRYSNRRGQSFLTLDVRSLPAPALAEVLAAAALPADGTTVLDGANAIPEALVRQLLSHGGSRLVLLADGDRDGRVADGWLDAVGVAWRVPIPPLRQRSGDIPAIARNLLQAHADRLDRGLEVSAAALDALAAHDWPGNVRELREVIAGAVQRAGAGAIEPDHLGLRPHDDRSEEERCLGRLAGRLLERRDGSAYAAWLERLDAIVLGAALRRSGGNRLAAAAALGMHRTTLRKRCRELGLAIPS